MEADVVIVSFEVLFEGRLDRLTDMNPRGLTQPIKLMSVR